MGEKTARVTRHQLIAPEVRLVEAVPVEPAAMTFKAGQFISVRCGEDGDVRRSYSIVSSPERSDRFELLVKDVPGGVGTKFFESIAVGGELHFTGPMGFFVADARHDGDAVVVATGAGIAAGLPIAEEIVRAGTPVRMMWGLVDGQAEYWKDRLDALGAGRWELVRGNDWIAVHEAMCARLEADLPSLKAPVFYLVGNGDLCRRARDVLVARGVDRRKQIRNEIFYPVMEGQK